VLLSGHTHNRLYAPVVVNRAVVIQSGCHGSFVGRLDLKIVNQRVKTYKHRLITIDESIKPNAAIQDMVDRALTKAQHSMLSTVVGKTRNTLSRWRTLESTMDNLLLQAALEASDAEIALSNGWRYGAPVPPGEVRMNDLWNIIPTNPVLSICDLTGAELWQMMEENLENTFSRDPYRQMGGYVKRVLGLHIYFKIENPYRKRIQEFFVNGHTVDPAKTYRVCCISSQAVPSRFGTNRRDLRLDAIEALQEYFTKHSPIHTPMKGTIVPI
jgi:2',3'-cyclic-nucleotide 2'-phosphodiesterase (5'-nucleotidase family)